MTAATLFTLANMSVLPFWLLLVIAPRWHGTQLLVHSVAMPVLLGGAYLWLFVTGAFWGADLPDGAGFGSLEGVKILFQSTEAVLAGWIHYLAFDLFVGAWIARDAERRDFSHWLTVPCLFFTLMTGPVGLLLYVILRAIFAKGGWSVAETTA